MWASFVDTYNYGISTPGRGYLRLKGGEDDLSADWDDQGDLLLSVMTLETSTKVEMTKDYSTLSIMISETSTLSGMSK